MSKKEARVSNDTHLGEIQQSLREGVIVQKDRSTRKHTIFNSLVKNFDGKILANEISENQVIDFKKVQSHSPTVRDQYLATTEIDLGGGSREA